jgi:nucleotide-binding universal stress UspA family protein
MLIPLDGGPFSAEVLPEAARFARSFGIDHIDLIAVLPPQMIHLDDLEGATPVWALEKMGIVSIGNGSYALDGQQPIVRQRLQELEHALEYWGDWLADSGADVETHVRYDIAADNTAASTLAWARELQSDFIVMRTHARRGLARTLTGSVADELVRRSPLPVLLYTTQALESLSGTPGAADVRIEIEA